MPQYELRADERWPDYKVTPITDAKKVHEVFVIELTEAEYLAFQTTQAAYDVWMDRLEKMDQELDRKWAEKKLKK
jgi:hypothetical protein